MNPREGMRRLGIVLGVVGGIIGGFFGYIEAQDLWNTGTAYKNSRARSATRNPASTTSAHGITPGRRDGLPAPISGLTGLLMRTLGNRLISLVLYRTRTSLTRKPITSMFTFETTPCRTQTRMDTLLITCLMLPESRLTSMKSGMIRQLATSFNWA